ncbi:sialidase family protein [Thiobacter aerophilum]|uniref:Sialidase family protein n=1 Tax=Thiobacter aerophilum TaxID=3121275 RepID=A0ABV0EF80_9BURK
MVRRLLFLLVFAASLAQPARAHEAHQAARTGLAVSVAADATGRLWRAQVWEGRVWVSRSDDGGRSFGVPVAVNAVPEAIVADGENRPKLAVVGSRIYVSWTQALSKPYTGHVRFAHSVDGGRTFAEPITVNDDREVISHRFDSLLVDGRGRVHLFWLDKRDAAAAQAQGEPYTGAALYHAVSEDGGASFGRNERLAAHSCECCRVVSALDADGIPLVLWRHVFGRNERDHALLRLDGRTKPVRVSFDRWEVDACPHHGPALAVAPDGTRHLAWFNDAPTRHGLFYARMDADGGMGTPLAFGDYAQQAAHPALAVAAGRVWLAWKEFDGRQALVRAMHSDDGGRSWSAPRSVAASSGASDHPLLVSAGHRVYLSWSTQLEGHRVIPLVPDDTP